MSTQQVYTETNEALDTLSEVWESMLKVLNQVSAAAASSFTLDPDLDQLSKTRKEYEALLTRLKTKVAWIQDNRPYNNKQQQEQQQLDPLLLEEQQQLRQSSQAVSDQLKDILSQSYALQFQIDMLLSASHDQPIQ
ncbi:uncharacterized protein BX664DRAFT_355030 [Halteromyces radiatus]|uniref:uncharacterized protein n=1 Tax=Halteromyces radiatus TaxID=101107 RepID=UPI002220D5A7|nr:uncharacterized protein BX664DRAFT_355030 [Halteromyces radiatus]KAI8099625.1 hypothetical protein BX664DRAFT_355030 [Halteromyces radiatus]